MSEADLRKFAELLAGAPAVTLADRVTQLAQAPAPLPAAGDEWTNWAGNQTCRPGSRPTLGSADLPALIQAAGRGGMRAHGWSGSWSALVPTAGHLLDAREAGTLAVDGDRVTVSAGVRTGQLSAALLAAGKTLGSNTVVPWITVGGALSVAAHGTGRAYGTLSDQLLSLEIVDGQGQVRTVARGDADFGALGCGLGALGIITRATFRCEPLFNLRVRDDVRTRWMDPTLVEAGALKALLEGSDYASALWWPGTEKVWAKTWTRTEEPAPLNAMARWPLDQLVAGAGMQGVRQVANVLARRPSLVPLFNALIFDQLEHGEQVMPAPFAFHFQTSYPPVWDMSYAFDAAGDFETPARAWRVVRDEIAERAARGIFPQTMAAHMRYLRGSDAWLSPSYGHRGSVIIELVTLKPDAPTEAYRRHWVDYFSAVEAQWLALGGRPHWGKVFSWGPGLGEPGFADRTDDIRRLYPRWAAFEEVRRRWDPRGVFENPLTRRLFG